MFFQNIKMTKNEFRRYASLPCTNRSGTRKLNCPIEKSALRAACYPSSPLIPTPTCAAVIMLTSFAPSPMAKVLASGCKLRTMLTMSAFYFGLTLQARTTSARSTRPISKSLSAVILAILTKLSPEIMTARGRLL